LLELFDIDHGWPAGASTHKKSAKGCVPASIAGSPGKTAIFVDMAREIKPLERPVGGEKCKVFALALSITTAKRGNRALTTEPELRSAAGLISRNRIRGPFIES
jgi:hypothetical protein